MNTLPAAASVASANPTSPHRLRQTTRLLAPILKQHAQEVAGRWMRRPASSDAPDVDFEQRLHEDRFLLAHIDALRIAGPSAMVLVNTICPEMDPGDVFARRVMALLADAADPAPAADALSEPGLEEAYWAAPAWLDDTELARAFQHTPSAPAVLAATRLRLPVTAAHIDAALAAANSPTARCRALQAAMYSTQSALPLVQAVLRHANHTQVAGAAARAAFRLGDRATGLGQLLRERAAQTVPAFDTGLALLVAGLPLADSRLLLQQEVQRGLDGVDRVQAVEASGDPLHLEWLCTQLDDEACHGLASSAFTSLTGIGLEDLMDEDPATPLSQHALRALQAADLSRPGQRRWMNGRPLDVQTVFDALLTGRLRQRRFAALHLALVAPTLPLLDVDAPATRQLAWMASDEEALTGERHG